MDQVMWIVVVVALVLAVAMSVVALRLLSRDRRRHTARVAALEAAAEYMDDEDAGPVDEERSFDVMYREPPQADDHLAPVTMFAATDEPQAPPRRWVALVGVAAVMAVLLTTAYTLLTPTTLDAAATPAQAPASPSASNTASRAQSALPLELLSLKHTADGTAFTVTGLVQNPLSGSTHPRVVAIVYLFDQSGAYFASGKADVEFAALRPGEESPFAIRIANTSPVARYRVGFRAGDGAVVAHVDRRGQAMAGLMTEGK